MGDSIAAGFGTGTVQSFVGAPGACLVRMTLGCQDFPEKEKTRRLFKIKAGQIDGSQGILDAPFLKKPPFFEVCTWDFTCICCTGMTVASVTRAAMPGICDEVGLPSWWVWILICCWHFQSIYMYGIVRYASKYWMPYLWFGIFWTADIMTSWHLDIMPSWHHDIMYSGFCLEWWLFQHGQGKTPRKLQVLSYCRFWGTDQLMDLTPRRLGLSAISIWGGTFM